MALRRVAQAASWLALAGTILPSMIFLAGKMEMDPMKTGMLVTTLVWFTVAPLWMGRASYVEEAS